MRLLSAFLLVLLMPYVVSAEEPTPTPKVRFPSVSEPRKPATVPTDAPVTLPPDTWYIVEMADPPPKVTVSPLGAVILKRRIGVKPESPVYILGRFVDSTEVEDRTYTGVYPEIKETYPNLFMIRSASPEFDTRCELLIWPEGAEEPLFRKTLVVSGKGPQPPPVVVEPTPIEPTPADPPHPTEPTVTPTTGKGFRVMFMWEKRPDSTNVALTREQANTLNSLELRQWLKTNTAEDGYRFWDKDTDVTGESEDWKGIMSGAQSWLTSPARKTQMPIVMVWKDKNGVPYPLPAGGVKGLITFLQQQKG